ncbi:MAG: type IX secretion system sortase PorU [Paludibacteraceae bacterium]|nr:type IX secretion system sortase PorU [Paludibacteraceae bacterium]
MTVKILRKIVLMTSTLLSLSISVFGGIHTFVEKSILSEGNDWVRISVDRTGVCKITYAMLVNWGIKNPEKAHVFGYGGAMLKESFMLSKKDDLPQVPVWIEKGNDGIFNEGDYILFYAQGPVSWEYNSTRKVFQHTENPYSDLGYYFISSEAGEDAYINDNIKKQAEGSISERTSEFLDYAVHEVNTSKPVASGRSWYGESFTNASTRNFTFQFPNLRTDTSLAVRVCAISTSTVGCSMNVAVGDENKNLAFTTKTADVAATSTDRTNIFTPEGDNVKVSLSYSGYNTGVGYLDYIEVNGVRALTMSGSDMPFRNPMISGREGDLVEFQLKGEEGLVIWNVTDGNDVQCMNVDFADGVYRFKDDASVLQEYVALNPKGIFFQPVYVGGVDNQNLHSIKSAEYVIITNEDYVSEAEEIADLHAEYEGVSTLVVTPQQIFNEYSSGTPDATAFRWLMKQFYDRAEDESHRPKNLLIFGDGTYDNKGYLKVNVPYNKVLTYQSVNSLHLYIYSYTSDDYFAFLDDADGTAIKNNSMDIGVGRIPVSSNSQARVMVDKIRAYMSDRGDWQTKMCYVADDDNDMQLQYTWQSDTIVKRLENNYPEYHPIRMFSDSYNKQTTANSSTYPILREQIQQRINSGLLLFNYIGHGSTEGLAAEKLISRTDVESMHNVHYPIFFTATCDFSVFDLPVSSTGENLLLRKEGGAIALFSTVRTVYASDNYELDKSFHEYFLKKEGGKGLTLGECFRRAKNDLAGNDNRLCYTLFGDPGIRIPLPNNIVVVDSVKRVSNVSSGEYVNLIQEGRRDTLQAMNTIRVKGRILSADSMLIDNFNGKIWIDVSDKLQDLQTLGNVTSGSVTYKYRDRINTIYSGSAQVLNGQFELVFQVPKDIAYNDGAGKMWFYALDSLKNRDANGYADDFIVGGTDNSVEWETEGPSITIYLNSPYFKNGEKVDNTSTFFAALSDKNGINVTGSSIGHDLQLTLSGDTSAIFNLNNYFETDFGTYQSGRVTYALPTLSDGRYRLTLRAWDLLNNSSSAMIDFVVNDAKSPALYQVVASPNPAVPGMDFAFVIKHDQPETDLECTLTVYNTEGREIWSGKQIIYAQTSETRLPWDLKTKDGYYLPSRIYPYRLLVQEKGGKESRTSGKLLIR